MLLSIVLLGLAVFLILSGYTLLFLVIIKSISSISLFLKCVISRGIELLSYDFIISETIYVSK